MSSAIPWSSSQRASASVYARMPRNPSRANARCSSAGTRTDFDARRIGVPPARITRSSAFASKASRSTTITGVASGPPWLETACSSLDHRRLRSMKELPIS